MSKAYEFLKECKVFFLASIKNDVPAIRPFGAVMEYNNELYFSTANTKEVYRQLCDNPAIQIVALKDGTRNWIRISGKAIEIDDLSVKQKMLDSCPILLKRFDTNRCPYFSLFKIVEMSAVLNTDTEIVKL